MRRAANITRDGDWLLVRFPYSAEAVTDLKSGIHHTERRWDPDRKVWVVAAYLERGVRALLRRHFDIAGEGEPTRPRVPVAANDYEELVGGLPLDGLRRIYRAVMREVHPDRGGDTRLAQRVNAAWARLEKRLARGVA